MKMVTLNELAKEAKVDPRIARMRLREVGDDAPPKQHPYNWLFAKRDARKVKKIIAVR